MPRPFDRIAAAQKRWLERMALPEDETPWISRGFVFGAEAPRTRRRNSAPWFLGNALHPFAKRCEAIEPVLSHKTLLYNVLGIQEVPFTPDPFSDPFLTFSDPGPC